MRARVQEAVESSLTYLGREATHAEMEGYAAGTKTPAAIETEIKESETSRRRLVTVAYQEVLGRDPTSAEMTARLGADGKVKYGPIETWLNGMRARVQEAVESSLTYLGREATQAEKE